MIKKMLWKLGVLTYKRKKLNKYTKHYFILTMPSIYPYTFTSDGDGPWWGIRCSTQFYQDTVRGLDNTTRCFVYITNIRGDTLAIAIEGPHTERTDDDTIFAPEWVFERLGINHGDEVIMDPILEPLPRGETVTIRPLTGTTVEGPMFLEGLTEALSQLGVVQEGLLSAIVDPSMPELHEFMIESLTPLSVCLADGELRVELERALDRPPTPEPEPEPEAEPEQIELPVNGKFVPFTGKGYRLG
jgi:hypothetical protein